MILNWPLQFGRRSIFRRNARKSPVVSVDSWPGPQFQPSRLDDCRLGTVARIGVLNDCSNRYLTLAPFWRGCPSTSEADVHCRSASCALPSLSRVGVIRPPGVGIFRPLGRAPNAISKRVAEVAILQHEWGPLEAPFWTLARPSDHGMRGRRVRCNRRCGAAGPAWPRRAAGWWQTRGPIRQSPGCW